MQTLTPLWSTVGRLICSQQGPMILRFSTSSSNALVFVPNTREKFGLSAWLGIWGSRDASKNQGITSVYLNYHWTRRPPSTTAIHQWARPSLQMRNFAWQTWISSFWYLASSVSGRNLYKHLGGLEPYQSRKTRQSPRLVPSGVCGEERKDFVAYSRWWCSTRPKISKPCPESFQWNTIYKQLKMILCQWNIDFH